MPAAMSTLQRILTPQWRASTKRLLTTSLSLHDHEPRPHPEPPLSPAPSASPAPPAAPPLSIQVAVDRKFLILSDGTERRLRFHAAWLRHNCQCDLCKQPFSGQKLIDAARLQPSYTVNSVTTLPQDVAAVTWNEERHTSLFPLAFLRDHEYSISTLAERRAAGRPTPCTGQVPAMTRADLRTERGVLRWLRLINEFGLCVVRGVPTEDGEVRRIAELMGPIQHTIYGDVWDVRSDPQPINVAYSDAELDFHMDLAYYESPPGVQFLHCIRFDDCVEGGDSQFVDAWHVAETLRALDPDQFATLARVPATFQKVHFTRDSPVHMRYQRPHVVLEPGGRIVAVNWAPAFEGPLQVPEYEVEAYYRAYRTYAQMLHSSVTKLKFRMAPGDLVSFNNRRILHGREAFSLNGGMRHLQGCYVNIDEFRSSLEVMARRTNARVTVKHVLNQCWF